MPRVGLNKAAEDDVVAYIQKVGDSKKAERESTGIYVMIYFFILGIFCLALETQSLERTPLKFKSLFGS